MAGRWEEVVYPFVEAKKLAAAFFHEPVPGKQLEPHTDKLPDDATFSYLLTPFLLEDIRDSLGDFLRSDLPQDVLALYGALAWLESGKLQPSDTGGIELIQRGPVLIEETIAPLREYREMQLPKDDLDSQLEDILLKDELRGMERERNLPEGTWSAATQDDLESHERQIAFWEGLKAQVQSIATTLGNELEAIKKPPLPDR